MHARQLDPARLFGGPDAVAATPRPLAWPPSALTGEQPRLLCSIRMKDIVLKLEEREGVFCRVVTHVNSGWKDYFAEIYFHGSSGSSVQVCFSFMAKTLENHNKS